MEDEMSYCINCKREIPLINFVTHTMHCSRKITLCESCSEPVPRTEMEAHQREFHSVKECDACGEQMDVNQLKTHKTDSCPSRRVNCSICELELPASEIPDHENYCGSRTELCEECEEYVMLKYQKLHLESNHTFLKLDDEPGPTPSWQQNNDRGATGTVNNDLRSPKKVHNLASGIGATARNPLFASSSLSKRTNDMPQVNSAMSPFSFASKEVHKAGMMKDADNSLRNHNSGMVDGDITALFSENLRIGEASQPKASSSGTNAYSYEEDLVALPCEFCEALVPANQLILHQTACRPDLARIDADSVDASGVNEYPDTSDIHKMRPRLFNTHTSYKIHNDLLKSPPPPLPFSKMDTVKSAKDETLLPCEFCDESLSISQFYDHQDQCSRNQPGASAKGKTSSADPPHRNSEYNIKSGRLAYEKNFEFMDASKLRRKNGDFGRKNAMPVIVPRDIKTEPKTAMTRYTRDIPNHSFDERLAPAPHRNRFNQGLNQHEDVDERQALLNRAEMMDRINNQVARMKDAQINHMRQDFAPIPPRRHKQSNHVGGSGSHPYGSFASVPNRPQPSRGGYRTGAIPKQKAGTRKSPIAF